jgi:acetoacetyl-[acyl-carrier protein] synthase
MPFTADAAFINAKGFGGNNATGVVLSPAVTERLMTQRHGKAAMAAWKTRRAATREVAAAYHQAADRGHFQARYRFGEGVLEGPELDVGRDEIHIPGFARSVSLAVDNPFGRLEDEDDS